MNPVLRAIFDRRSIRQYTCRVVAQRDLETIVQAGRYAPSAWNAQGCNFLVVTNKTYIHRLAAATAAHLEGEIGNHNFFGASSLIIVWGRRDNFDLFYDTGAAVQNMFLAAQSLGIGSVWCNQFLTISDEDDVVTLLDEMGIPGNSMISAIAVFGYADESPAPAPRTSQVSYLK